MVGGDVAGTADLYVNGSLVSSASATKGTYGDSLNRPIGIGELGYGHTTSIWSVSREISTIRPSALALCLNPRRSPWARWAVWRCWASVAGNPDCYFMNAKAASNGGLSAFCCFSAFQESESDGHFWPHPQNQRPFYMSQPQPNKPNKAIERLCREASEAWRRQDYPKSISLLEQAVQKEPSNPSLHLNLARAHGLRYDYSAVERCIEKALQVSQGRVEILEEAAGICSTSKISI